MESYFSMFFVLEARLWIVLILWPDQPWMKELADFVSIVMCLSCKLWACCNNVLLFQTGEVETERNEPDWSCRSACSLFHSRYSWSQFYFLLVKNKKASSLTYTNSTKKKTDMLQFDFLDLSLIQWEGVVRWGWKDKYPIYKLRSNC